MGPQDLAAQLLRPHEVSRIELSMHLVHQLFGPAIGRLLEAARLVDQLLRALGVGIHGEGPRGRLDGVRVAAGAQESPRFLEQLRDPLPASPPVRGGSRGPLQSLRRKVRRALVDEGRKIVVEGKILRDRLGRSRFRSGGLPPQDARRAAGGGRALRGSVEGEVQVRRGGGSEALADLRLELREGAVLEPGRIGRATRLPALRRRDRIPGPVEA